MEILLEGSLSTPESDLELVRRIAQGDERALHRLYAVYGQRLFAYAVRLTGDPAAAEDVVQDCLVSVWQGARRFRGEGRVIAWLLGIVHHKALNARRAQRPESSQPWPEEDAGELPDGSPAPDDLAARSEQARLLRLGLKQLSFEHRTVLELIFYQGLSLQEAAEVCGCPVGTVKSRLSHAKASLRGVLSRDGFRAEDVE